MDKALKQRLVGASVLIALAVIILPMLLGGRPESGQQQMERIELPARPDGVAFETRRFPLADEGTTPQQQTDSAQQTEQPEVAEVNQQDPESTNSELAQQSAEQAEQSLSTAGADGAVAATDPPVRDPVQEGLPAITSVEVPDSVKVDLPVAVEAASDSPPLQSSAGRFAVQVASLGSEANARKLQAELESKGFQVISDKIESDVGSLNRVRVGPFNSEAEATAAARNIQIQVDGVNPRMVDIDPSAPTQDINPSDPLVRWVVQLGSFAENLNAENLVKQVRAQGLSAYSEKVTSSSGTSINRVRVGPFLQREDATSAQQSLKSSLSINGVVMSAD